MEMEEKKPTETNEVTEKEEIAEKKGFWKENWSTVVMGVFVAVFAATLLLGLWKPVMVHMTSMYPTLQEKDYLFIFRTNDYQPGDIVVFNSAALGEENLIKRVIAVGGDHVEVRGGKVYVNGAELHEDYLPEGLTTEGDVDLTLLPGELFVMGDNRTVSVDGRYFGAIDAADVLGEAKIRIFHKPTLF